MPLPLSICERLTFGVFPIDIKTWKQLVAMIHNTQLVAHTIESQIQHQTSRRFGKSRPASLGTSRLREIRRVSPATDRKQNLQLAVLLLEQEKLLGTSVHIGTDVIPRIIRIMLLNVRPRVGQVAVVQCQRAIPHSAVCKGPTGQTYTSPFSGRTFANA